VKAIKAIDLHSHFATEKGYLYKGAEAVKLAEKIYKMKVEYKTEWKDASRIWG